MEWWRIVKSGGAGRGGAWGGGDDARQRRGFDCGPIDPGSGRRADLVACGTLGGEVGLEGSRLRLELPRQHLRPVRARGWVPLWPDLARARTCARACALVRARVCERTAAPMARICPGVRARASMRACITVHVCGPARARACVRTCMRLRLRGLKPRAGGLACIMCEYARAGGCVRPCGPKKGERRRGAQREGRGGGG